MSNHGACLRRADAQALPASSKWILVRLCGPTKQQGSAGGYNPFLRPIHKSKMDSSRSRFSFVRPHKTAGVRRGVQSVSFHSVKSILLPRRNYMRPTRLESARLPVFSNGLLLLKQLWSSRNPVVGGSNWLGGGGLTASPDRTLLELAFRFPQGVRVRLFSPTQVGFFPRGRAACDRYASIALNCQFPEAIYPKLNSSGRRGNRAVGEGGPGARELARARRSWRVRRFCSGTTAGGGLHPGWSHAGHVTRHPDQSHAGHVAGRPSKRGRYEMSHLGT